MDKKGNKGLIVFLVVLIITVLCLSGYILVDKDLIKLGKKEVNTEEKLEKSNKEKTGEIEVLEVIDPTVQSLYNNISRGLGYFCGVDAYYTDSKVTNSSISNQLAFSIALIQLGNSGIEIVNEGVTFTKEQINAEIYKIFGKNYRFKHQTRGSCPVYTYDESTGVYTIEPSACGGTCGAIDLKKIVKAVKIDETVEIYVRILFVGEETSNDSANGTYYSYYKDYNKTQVLTLDRDYDNMVLQSDENFAKGSLYKLKFAKEDNNYVFVESSLVS